MKYATEFIDMGMHPDLFRQFVTPAPEIRHFPLCKIICYIGNDLLITFNWI